MFAREGKERKKVKGQRKKGREGKEREGNAKSKTQILHYCSRSRVNK